MGLFASYHLVHDSTGQQVLGERHTDVSGGVPLLCINKLGCRSDPPLSKRCLPLGRTLTTRQRAIPSPSSSEHVGPCLALLAERYTHAYYGSYTGFGGLTSIAAACAPVCTSMSSSGGQVGQVSQACSGGRAV